MPASTTQRRPAGTEIFTGQHTSVITAAENNNLKTTAGHVGQVSIWGADAGTTVVVTVYDHPSSNTNPIWSWKTADGLGTFALQMVTGNGIRVVTSGTMPTSGGVTITWS